MQHQAQIGGLCLMLCTDNNVTDTPLMERNWRKCVIIIIIIIYGVLVFATKIFCIFMKIAQVVLVAEVVHI